MTETKRKNRLLKLRMPTAILARVKLPAKELPFTLKDGTNILLLGNIIENGCKTAQVLDYYLDKGKDSWVYVNENIESYTNDEDIAVFYDLNDVAFGVDTIRYIRNRTFSKFKGNILIANDLKSLVEFFGSASSIFVYFQKFYSKDEGFILKE